MEKDHSALYKRLYLAFKPFLEPAPAAKKTDPALAGSGKEKLSLKAVV
ncbi:MAG: hypothetical protein ACJAZ9_000066 [Neolewinella sp.]